MACIPVMTNRYAHNRNSIRNCFVAPLEPNKNFDYPFYYDEENDYKYSDRISEVDFYYSISKIPGKQRHLGFTLAVIGRLPLCWQRTMWKIIKIILITRIVPPSILHFTQVLIPKQEKISQSTRETSQFVK